MTEIRIPMDPKPTDEFASVEVSRAPQESEQPESAIEYLAEALKQSPDDHRLHHAVGDAAGCRGTVYRGRAGIC